ncbi:MAG: VOC family protein [Ignavibacteria bacterium]|nr:VOC family protein [Ignavibacteria bacterium]
MNKVKPIFRIFDYNKAVEFYVDFLGFKIDWENRGDDGKAPVYMQVSRGDVTLHLSEHHGDASPGSNIFVEYKDVMEYNKELVDKKYKYNRPGVDEMPWGALEMKVHDPFGNRISFNQYLDSRNDE